MQSVEENILLESNTRMDKFVWLDLPNYTSAYHTLLL